MEVKLNANVYDQGTEFIASALREPFERIEAALSGNYGGTIQHLWIDFELIDHGRKPFPFRFQKRVSGKSRISGIDFPDCFDVGHYSVAPDFHELASLPQDRIVPYALQLILKSTTILLDKQKKLGGFDAARFRAAFLHACAAEGHELAG